MTYRVSLDTFNKAITIIVILIILFAFYHLTKEDLNIHGLIDQGGAAILIIAILVISYGFSPKSYTLTNDKLIITRRNNKILITFKGNNKILLTPDSLEMLEELKKRMV